MSKLARYINASLSLKLSLSILAFTAVIFMVALGILFHSTRQTIRQTAIEQTTQILNNTALNIMNLMGQVEVAIENSDWLVMRNLSPDSIMSLSRQILERNPDINGCSVSF